MSSCRKYGTAGFWFDRVQLNEQNFKAKPGSN